MSGLGFLNGTLNGSAGSAQGREGTTITTFIISLAAGIILFSVQFGIFLIIRNYLWAKRIYQPRSFLVPVKQRIKPPHNNPIRWLNTLFRIKEDPEVLQKAGMDAYFFLRFLSMCLKIFTPLTFIIIPVLIPLNAKQGKGTTSIHGVSYNVTGLDTLAWSNVSPNKTTRYWAHLILAIGVVAWVCYIFHQELLHYITKRMEYLRSPAHQVKASSTTVLIQDIPKNFCNETALEELYGDFPGGIRRIWINRDFTALVKKDKLRDHYENLLEESETDLLRKVAKQARKANLRQKEAMTHESSEQVPQTAGSGDGQLLPMERPAIGLPPVAACEKDLEYDLVTKAEWTRYLTPKQRHTMRVSSTEHTVLAKVPFVSRFFSTQVDTIYYCRRELARLNKEIEVDVSDPGAYPQNYSAFVQFRTQKAAHLACQSIADTTPRHMRKRVVEISPADINWSSLNLSWRARYVRLVSFFFLFAVLLFLFGVISFITGILSKASTLSGSTSWLRWIDGLPPWLLSFVQGTLPPVIQVIVLSGPLPILLRLLTNGVRGATTGQEGERSLQTWYFIFLVIELFIIPTISSGLTSIITELVHTPQQVPNILATNLPTAANYFFSFLILQALSLSATSILQTIRLLKFYVFGHVNTPDSVFEKLSWTNLTRIGSNVPWYTTFAVIGLVYSVIAPLMLLFMLITFSLFWVVIKNNLLYCVRTGTVDGGGLFFPHAINQMFTGLYFMEICLIGLFFLVRDTQDRVACDAQGIIMAVVFVFTVLYQIWLMTHLHPLFEYAPVALEMEAKALLAEHREEEKTVNQDAEKVASTADVGHAAENSTPVDSPSYVQSPAQNMEKVQEAGNESQQRPPIWQRQSSQRSSDLIAQQLDDTRSAERILARINQPLDEARLAQLEQKLARPTAAGIGSVLLPRRKDIEEQMLDDPISKIIKLHNDELENLDTEERDMLTTIAFMHPILRETKPSVWIPSDAHGVSDDEVRRTREMSADVAIDNRGAYFDRRLKVQVDKPPPDMSQFALIMSEL